MLLYFTGLEIRRCFFHFIMSYLLNRTGLVQMTITVLGITFLINAFKFFGKQAISMVEIHESGLCLATVIYVLYGFIQMLPVF